LKLLLLLTPVSYCQWLPSAGKDDSAIEQQDNKEYGAWQAANRVLVDQASASYLLKVGFLQLLPLVDLGQGSVRCMRAVDLREGTYVS
jgi:hypothetical protein